MVTSKHQHQSSFLLTFFFQVSLLKNSQDFPKCMIKQRCLSSMVDFYHQSSFANWMAFVKISSLMDR